MRFRISKNRNGEYYFEIQAAGNYETLATSEGYRSKADCERAINLIRTQAATATVDDRSG